TPEFVEKLQKKVQEDPSKSCTKLAEELGVGNTTVRPDFDREGQENRFYKALKLLNKLKHPVHNETLWFFSDEKNFTQDQKHNSQNNRCCLGPHEVPIVAQTKFPAAVIVFGIISPDGDVMPPHFFPKGLRLDSEGVCGTHEGFGGPLDKEGCRGRPYVFQQDSAPCHTSRKTQKWLSKNLDDYTSPTSGCPTPPTATRATSTMGRS
ncbi:Uncharacterized protein FKW44_018918, partial [Caligus rogercresseyi]